MSNLHSLLVSLENAVGSLCTSIEHNLREATIEVPYQHLQEVCERLKSTIDLKFEMLLDICGVDYLHYEQAEWMTHQSSSKGFSRAVDRSYTTSTTVDNRFAAVYHLLSLTHNHRVRIRSYAVNEPPTLPSVIEIWNAADWYEREAFDLFGIVFEGHNDLRRILTDYGFIGHPFRKDFPLSGHVEVRYDHEQQRVIYEPVKITPRVLVPKTIRNSSSLGSD